MRGVDISTANAYEYPCAECAGPGGFYSSRCWECSGLKPLREVVRVPPWAVFRRELIDACKRATGVFEYVSADRFGTRCPRCRDAMGVFFHGETFDVEFFCLTGCVEREVAEALFGGDRR